MVDICSSSCEEPRGGGGASCAASDGGTNADMIGFLGFLALSGDGIPRPLSMGFFERFAIRSNLRTLGEESTAGDELPKTLTVPARRRPCAGSGVLSGEADRRFLDS